MADYVLDTHTVIFALVTPKRLGTRARRVISRIEAGHDRGFIPVAVATEIVMIHELARTAVGLAELEEVVARVPRLVIWPLDLDQVREFEAHAVIPDPFDRLIIAATRALGAKLVTRDERLRETGLVETVWD